ncbi:hypothetical protein [Streptomyces venetus]|uniref:hypothetical protein n=1 Tax=Streptomyces venetus TaxID=1701086 RepID=UPI003C2ED45F
MLGLARRVLEDPESPCTEVRYAGLRLAECLTDALRVAESRGQVVRSLRRLSASLEQEAPP